MNYEDDNILIYNHNISLQKKKKKKKKNQDIDTHNTFFCRETFGGIWQHQKTVAVEKSFYVCLN